MAERRRNTYRGPAARGEALRGVLSRELSLRLVRDRYSALARLRAATNQHLAGPDDELGESARGVPLDRIPSLPPDGVTLQEVRSRAEAVSA
ncbi:hypothetical protein [Nocardioides sp. 503]|uniref:hypothetical protein n=1 Tax=Nocardioides sp. 503 TaxID=2508326 RepID=UPI00106F122A|nr:hypothetical protein [Nocardioides sp. 503]